jgi:hypothetical protein
MLVVNYDTEAVINRKTTTQANRATHSSTYLPKKCYYKEHLHTHVQYDKCVSPFWGGAVVSILHVLSNLYVSQANSLDYMKYLHLWFIMTM